MKSPHSQEPQQPMVTRKKACDSCHNRKIGCDGAVPQCNWCKHHNLPCTFLRNVGRKKRVSAAKTTRSGSQSNLAKRMDRIEQLLDGARQAWATRTAATLEGVQQGPLDAEPPPPPPPPAPSNAAVQPGSPMKIEWGDPGQPGYFSVPSVPSQPPPAYEPPMQQSPMQLQQQQSLPPPPPPPPQQPPRPQHDHNLRERSNGGSSGAGGVAGSGRSAGMAGMTSNSPRAYKALTSAASFGELHFSGFSLGEISSYNGIPFFSAEGQKWIRSRAGIEPSFDSLFGSGPLWQREPQGWPTRLHADIAAGGGGSSVTTSPAFGGSSAGAGAAETPDGSSSMSDASPASGMLIPPTEAVELPEREFTEQCVNIFRSSSFAVAFPLIDPVLFETTIEEAYAHEASGGGGAGWSKTTINALAARACIFAFISMVSLFGRDDSSLPAIDGDSYALAAHNLMSQILPGVSVTTLEAVEMLAVFFLFSGDMRAGATLLTHACKILFMLGAHRVSEPRTESSGMGGAPDLSRRGSLADPMSATTTSAFFDQSVPVEDEEEARFAYRVTKHIRQLFWTCYVFDKEVALRTGLPPSIDDDYCDVELLLPHLTAYWTEDLAELTDLTANPNLASYLVSDKHQRELSLLKSKTSRRLYSAAALRRSDAELLRDIRELDDELERWRMSVPAQHRPVLNFTGVAGMMGGGGGGSGQSPSQIKMRGGPGQAADLRRDWMAAAEDGSSPTMHEIMLHFEYHHLIATIHRASGRSRAWACGEGGELAGVSSSQALSVQASRSTIFYLQTAIRTLSEMAFWMILFYPMSAILTIFCNLLLHPLAEQAESDLQLLRSVPELLKEMRTRHLTPNEVVHMKMVDDFVQELSRLGYCATIKARRERGFDVGAT